MGDQDGRADDHPLFARPGPAKAPVLEHRGQDRSEFRFGQRLSEATPHPAPKREIRGAVRRPDGKPVEL